MNDVKLIGRLTKDPEVRKSSKGNDCVHFTLAVKRKFRKPKKQDDADVPEEITLPKQDADFINCVAWNGWARSIGKNCKQGSRIGISGPLQSRMFEVDGVKKYIVEVVAKDIDFLDWKDKTPASDQTTSLDEFQATPVSEEEMDIY